MAILILVAQAYANEPVANATADEKLESRNDIHLGVASCSGSNCHGAVRPYANSSVVQNEYVIWNTEDTHSKAYLVLLSERSKRIAQNLRLKTKPEESSLCLDCHADNVPVKLRGKRFDLADGVSCEACHGGGERYLGPHVSGEVTHRDNIKFGLFPTDIPEKRANLCLKCHLGNSNQFATHKIMGAGHPRLSFELDTYTEIHKHYVVDKDYLERKGLHSHAMVWAQGQIIAAINTIELLQASLKNAKNSLRPELAFYDCQSCHHNTDEQSNEADNLRAKDKKTLKASKLHWVERELSGELEPGDMHYNDAYFVTSAIIADAVSPDTSHSIRQGIINLQNAGRKGPSEVEAACTTLLAHLKALQQKLDGNAFSKSDLSNLLAGIRNRSASNDFYAFAAAEQAVMAVDAIRFTFKSLGTDLFSEAQINELRDTTKDGDHFDPARFNLTLQKLAPYAGN